MIILNCSENSGVINSQKHFYLDNVDGAEGVALARWRRHLNVVCLINLVFKHKELHIFCFTKVENLTTLNCAHPDGVDVDDVDDVDERRHFGVVLLVGGCLDGVFVDEGVVVEARDELLSDGLAVEGEPRYLCDETYA